MRTQLATFQTYADKTFRTEYGVKVLFRGCWAFLGDGLPIYRVPTKAESEAKRAELRKEKWT